jgi:Domain of unknown function (DUF4169)
MAEIVNLHRARKSKAKSERTAQATENRARFGRSKSDRKLEQARADKASKDLAQHRRDPARDDAE